MDTTTAENEYACQEHNVPCWECDCEGYYCPHGEYVQASIARSVYEINSRRKWYLKTCSCANPATDRQLLSWRDQSRSEDKKKSSGLTDESKPGNWYLITLTQPDLDKSVDKRILAAKKVLRSKQVSPEQWCYSIELTAKGTPHIHIAVFTYKYPEFRVIKGFNDGYQVDITREKFNVRNYVVKDDTKPSKAMLATWGLDTWFFHSPNYSGPRPAAESPDSPTRILELKS